MSKNILITGGSGLVGTHLSHLLINNGYSVSHLSRNPDNNQLDDVKAYHWDVNDSIIDEKAIQDADIIIHLAGAGIADKRWTSSRKKVILASRVESSKLLHSYL